MSRNQLRIKSKSNLLQGHVINLGWHLGSCNVVFLVVHQIYGAHYFNVPQGLTAASMLPAAPELLTVKTNFEFIQTFDRYWSSLYIFEMLSTFLLWLCTWHAFDLLWMLSKEQSLFFMIWFRSRILFPTFLQTITFFSKSAVCQTSIFGCDWGQLILKLLLIELAGLSNGDQSGRINSSHSIIEELARSDWMGLSGGDQSGRINTSHSIIEQLACFGHFGSLGVI